MSSYSASSPILQAIEGLPRAAAPGSTSGRDWMNRNRTHPE
jgi:hypothetical protein